MSQCVKYIDDSTENSTDDVNKQQLGHVTGDRSHVTVRDLAAPSGENANCSASVALFIVLSDQPKFHPRINYLFYARCRGDALLS